MANIFVEAESIQNLVEFSTETNTVARGGSLIRLPGQSDVSGTATISAEDAGLSVGTYNLTIHYFDENDGEATLGLKIGSSLDVQFILNDDVNSSPLANEDSKRTKVFNNVIINDGTDQIVISGTTDGTQNSVELVRVDYLEFEPIDTTTPNQAPTANNDSDTTEEGQAKDINVLGNDTDPDDDALTVTEVGDAANGSVEIINSGQTVRYTPNEGFSGPDDFTYTISDGEETATATVTVTVNPSAPPNQAPTANNDSDTTEEGQAKDINVLGNDTDPDDDALTVTEVGDAANGSVEVINSGQTVRYTPNEGFSGPDNFTYTISDGEETATATVTVTVNASEDSTNSTETTGPGNGSDDSDIGDGGNIGNAAFFKTENNLFGVDSSNPTEIIKFTVINQAKPGWKFGVVQVDDAGGSIDGTNPGDEGYGDKVLQKKQYIYSTPGDFDSADFLSSLGGVSRYLAAQDEAFYRLVALDSEGELILGDASENGPLSFTYLSDKDAYNLDWDVDGDGATDFRFEADISDLGSIPFGSAIQDEQGAEIINLGSNSGTFKVTVDIFEEAEFNNYIGFVQVDENFEINGVGADAEGFAEAALSQWFNNPNNPLLNIEGDGILNGAEFTVDAANGQYVVPFLVTQANVLEINGADFSELAERTFFSFPAANPDGIDHVRMFGNNIFGFEDTMGGGDEDFDDAVIRLNVHAA